MRRSSGVSNLTSCRPLCHSPDTDTRRAVSYLGGTHGALGCPTAGMSPSARVHRGPVGARCSRAAAHARPHGADLDLHQEGDALWAAAGNGGAFIYFLVVADTASSSWDPSLGHRHPQEPWHPRLPLPGPCWTRSQVPIAKGNGATVGAQGGTWGGPSQGLSLGWEENAGSNFLLREAGFSLPDLKGKKILICQPHK